MRSQSTADDGYVSDLQENACRKMPPHVKCRRLGNLPRQMFSEVGGPYSPACSPCGRVSQRPRSEEPTQCQDRSTKGMNGTMERGFA